MLPLILAHLSPLGWQYDPDCCSNRDCAPAHVEIRREGYFVRDRGTLIPYGDNRIRESGDGMYHVCGPAHYIRCLYIPPLGG